MGKPRKAGRQGILAAAVVVGMAVLAGCGGSATTATAVASTGASAPASVTASAAAPSTVATSTVATSTVAPTTATSSAPAPPVSSVPSPPTTSGTPLPVVPTPKLMSAGSATCSSGYLSARYTFDAIDADWRVGFTGGGLQAHVNGAMVTVSGTVVGPVLAGHPKPVSISGSIIFSGSGGREVRVAVNLVTSC